MPLLFREMEKAMELKSFSVRNYRSIQNAQKLPISRTTVLVGPNNEGKSNILRALSTAMAIIKGYGDVRVPMSSMFLRRYADYEWDRDIPIRIRESKPNSKTIFTLEFGLNEDDKADFLAEIGSRINESLPIRIEIGPKGRPEFKIVKQGPGQERLNESRDGITRFIGNRIDVNYIPAVRTDDEANRVVIDMVEKKLATLEADPKYEAAMQLIERLQTNALEAVSTQLTESVKGFLKDVKSIDVEISRRRRRQVFTRSVDVYVDDGNRTNLSEKGEGVKSLAAMSLLRLSDGETEGVVQAIEEPESHLHPMAIHRLKETLSDLSKETQVVITTHNPIFVDRKKIASNILVTSNTAKPAKTIDEVREVLGVKITDNLKSARLAIIVEGESDKIFFEALFNNYSKPITEALERKEVVFLILGGASKLGYQLRTLEVALCEPHVIFDNDSAAKSAIEDALSSKILDTHQYNVVSMKSKDSSELEDLYDEKFYRNWLLEKYGIRTHSKKFRSKAKWSNRLLECASDSGVRLDESQFKSLKTELSKFVTSDLSMSIPGHSRLLLDALIERLVHRLNGME